MSRLGGPETDALELLDAVVASIGGDVRSGQREMCAAVARSIAGGQHLLVEAPTGVGKSLAYASAVAAAGHPTVIATSTKALQEQLVTKDLPAVAEVLHGELRFALLKGRSNYLCIARASESLGTDVLGRGAPVHQAPQLEGLSIIQPSTAEVITKWARSTTTGDRADLPEEVGAQVWSTVSVSPLECPGAAQCHRSSDCFAEAARDRAAEADVVVVNTHLYAHDLRSHRNLLPPHEVVIIDEAHDLPAIATEVFGAALTGGRFSFLANRVAAVVADPADVSTTLRSAGEQLDDTIAGLGPGRTDAGHDELAAALLAGREALTHLRHATGGVDTNQLDVAAATNLQTLVTAAAGLAADLDRAAHPADHEVLWIDEGGRPQLRLSPIEVGANLVESLFRDVTVVCTSATLRTGPDFAGTAEVLGVRLADQPDPDPGADGGEAAATDDGDPHQEVPRAAALHVDSPFDHRTQAMLYVPRHLPDPRHPDHAEAAFAEALTLIAAAGGRTLFLHTSHRSMRNTAERLRADDRWEVLLQDEQPRPVLVERFGSSPSSVLVATMSFWQGVDVPGDACILVLIDRLPFPRPDQPLMEARRQRAEAGGRNGWAAVDLPRAAVLLAQGTGRLVRSMSDRGVVAVLDPRLATKGYRRTLLGGLPPFRRTVDGNEARAFLAAIHADAAGSATTIGASQS